MVSEISSKAWTSRRFSPEKRQEWKVPFALSAGDRSSLVPVLVNNVEASLTHRGVGFPLRRVDLGPLRFPSQPPGGARAKDQSPHLARDRDCRLTSLRELQNCLRTAESNAIVDAQGVCGSLSRLLGVLVNPRGG